MACHRPECPERVSLPSVPGKEGMIPKQRSQHLSMVRLYEGIIALAGEKSIVIRLVLWESHVLLHERVAV